MSNAFRIFPTLSQPQCFLLFMGMLLMCTIIGSLTRNPDMVSLFGPANAVFIGFVARFPSLRCKEAWCGASFGYLLGELLTGASFALALIFTITNLLIVISILALYIRFRDHIRNAHRGYSYLLVFFFCGIGSLMGAAFQVATLPKFIPELQQHSPWLMAGLFASSELLMAILIIPIIFSTPPLVMLHDSIQRFRQRQIPSHQFFPLLALFVSILASFYISGPGAILFPIAALIWCALSYHHFPLTLLTGLSCLTILYHLSTGPFLQNSFSQNNPQLNIISTHIGIIMMALAPLTVSIINRVRNTLIRKLQHTLAHDELTHAYTRREFFKRANLELKRALEHGYSIAILMIDIDFFKKINDQYGHHAGDIALQTCANNIQESLRHQDLLGRLGGEEFAVLLHDVDQHTAYVIAERIRQRLSQKSIRLSSEMQIYVHMSIGIASSEHHLFSSLDSLMQQADHALYRAKRAGRNQVQVALHSSF